jgi:hypothetical protein
MTKAHKWIQSHFKELVDKYSGKYVAVSDKGVISFGFSSKEVEEEALKKYSKKKLSVILIPRKEDLYCLL